MVNHDEMKAGNLYLYTMDPDIDKDEKYKEIYVIALSENKNMKDLSSKYSKYPTWLCLLPWKSLGGLFPSEMIDITID